MLLIVAFLISAYYFYLNEQSKIISYSNKKYRIEEWDHGVGLIDQEFNIVDYGIHTCHKVSDTTYLLTGDNSTGDTVYFRFGKENELRKIDAKEYHLKTKNKTKKKLITLVR